MLKSGITLDRFTSIELFYTRKIAEFNKTRSDLDLTRLKNARKAFSDCFISETALMTYMGEL